MLTTCSSNGRRSRPPLAAKCRGRVAHRLTRGYEDGGGGRIIDHALVVVNQPGAGSCQKKFCRKSANWIIKKQKKDVLQKKPLHFLTTRRFFFSNDSSLV